MARKKANKNAEHEEEEEEEEEVEENEEEAEEEEEQVEMEKKAFTKKKNSDVSNRGVRITVILKVLMHCDGCARDVIRSLNGFQGVEKVVVDVESSKVTVVGEVDPIRIRDRVARRTRKHVDLVSPANPKRKPDPKQPQEKNPKEVPFTTTVLRIVLHCEGCTQRIHRAISKFRGVATVSIDSEKDLVTVRGIMDAKELTKHLKEKLKRAVEIIPPKKEGGKEKEKSGKKENQEKAPAVAMFHPYDGQCMYTIHMVPAPQIFSDENPNACSIM